MAEAQIAEGKAYYEKMEASGDYHVHPAGFLYRFITDGQTGKGESNNSSAKPGPTEKVEVHYEGLFPQSPPLSMNTHLDRCFFQAIFKTIFTILISNKVLSQPYNTFLHPIPHGFLSLHTLISLKFSSITFPYHSTIGKLLNGKVFDSSYKRGETIKYVHMILF